MLTLWSGGFSKVWEGICPPDNYQKWQQPDFEIPLGLSHIDIMGGGAFRKTTTGNCQLPVTLTHSAVGLRAIGPLEVAPSELRQSPIVEDTSLGGDRARAASGGERNRDGRQGMWVRTSSCPPNKLF